MAEGITDSEALHYRCVNFNKKGNLARGMLFTLKVAGAPVSENDPEAGFKEEMNL
jgi:hypothetical protein